MSLGEGDNQSSLRVSEAKKMCLGFQSENKRTRKQVYIDLRSYLSKKREEFSLQDLRNIFNEIQMYVLNGLRDKAEAVREEAISFINFLVLDVLPLNDYYLTYIFPVIVERIGTVELIEESEEIRLQLLQLLHAIILKYSNLDQLKPFLNDSVIILSEVVKDKHPAIKELGCRCVVDLSLALPKDFHMQAESLVKPVITCFGHQRYKVRVEAIKCIGEIVMHSTYKALDEAVGPLAERLFDQIPIVRRTVAQVAARWLCEYRDRYSFFYKILPLLLTGLNDEVIETRNEAHELWVKVGLQYQRENEKDLKEQMDFLITLPKYYPEHFTRPNLGCRVLVQRNIGKIAPAIANELQSWQADVRVRCSQLLCSVALCAEGGLTQHLQILFPAMYSAARDEDNRVVENVIEASKLLGLFVPVDTWSKLVMPIIEEGPHYGHITVLTNLIHGSPQEYIYDSLETISKALADDDICYSRKKKFQREMVKCVQAIATKNKANYASEVGYHLFKVLVANISLRDKENMDIISAQLLEDLSNHLEISVNEMWSKYTPKLLKDINHDPKSWTVVTFQRCLFETILLESREAFGENLDLIADILTESLNPDNDPESRLKTFWALSEAFEMKDVIFKNSSDLTCFLEKLIVDVFVPSLVWHAGLTAEAMRTMAASCLRSALQPTEGVDLFSDQVVLSSLVEQLLPLLLSLVEDASHKSRQLAIECLVLLKQITTAKDVWTLEYLVQIYPEIMKRLDDPTESVRLCALRSLSTLFKECPPKFKELHYRAHHELIIDTLLTHYDDDDEEVQRLVYDILKVVGEINKSELSGKLERQKPLLRNQVGCDMILDHLKGLDIAA